MICALCGKAQRSNPAIESGWRYIECDGIGGYVCPEHLPANLETATTEEWADCYAAILITILGLKAKED